MYHFVSEPTEELRLSDNVLISGRTTQFLKNFQLEAIRFLYERLSKQEFCIYNDESGLGKSAAVVALLSGIGANKKTLIVLQNDDQLLAGWQFHLDILTDLPVCVIKGVNDTTESTHSVYLSKWSVLRSIGDLSKLNFDYIIVDHRGFTLNNNFCTSMLLKQYERRINIVISSVDITSDLKLLYNVLRLGGCLEHEHKSYQSFARKFHLPDVKEVLSKRVDLEEYYKQRGVLGEYVKEYRLRRYRHQFESYLPLVSPDQYKINVSLWLGQNNSSSTLSGSVIESLSEGRSTGISDEIFESQSGGKMNSELLQKEDTEHISLSGHWDEVMAMEPLIMETSDSEIEEVKEAEDVLPQAANKSAVMLLSSDDCEIVTHPTTSASVKPKRKYTKRKPITKHAEQAQSVVEEQPTSTKGAVKKLNIRLNRVGLLPKTNSKQSLARVLSTVIDSTEASVEKKKSPTIDILRTEHKQADCSDTRRSLRALPDVRTPKHKPLPVTPKTEPRTKRSNEVDSLNAEPRITRGMNRVTRSADSRKHSKYMSPLKSLDSDKKGISQSKRKADANQTPKSSKRIRSDKKIDEEEETDTPKISTSSTNGETLIKRPRGRPPKKNRSKPIASVSDKRPSVKGVPTRETKTPATPELLSSGSIISDNSYLQCAQKLPDDLAELDCMELPSFRVPYTPQATPLILPLNLNCFSDSEVSVVPAQNEQQEVLVINSSHDENSLQSSDQSFSRRTRALKRKRTVHHKKQPEPSTSNFGMLLAQEHRQPNKSPDIFSHCSDLSQLKPAQPVPTTSQFEGFKIFGSEVKQQNSNTQTSLGVKKKRERSCLDILEQMFEPQQATKTMDTGVQLLPTLLSPKQKPVQRRFTLLDDDIFEITNNGEFGSRLRLNSTGNVSPVQQQQQQHQQMLPQRNKITKYLISSGGVPEEAGQRSQASQALRKSPKGVKSMQSTKLTRWFGTTNSGESQSAPSTPVVPADKVAGARAARSGGAGKRRRLDLSN